MGLLPYCALVAGLWNAAFLLSPWLGVWAPVSVAGLFLVALAPRVGPVRPLLVPTRAGLLLGLGSAAVMVALTYLLFPLAIRILPPLAEHTRALYALMRGPGSFAAPLLLPWVVLVEEIAYRGPLMSRLQARHGPAQALVGSAVLYAAAHVASGHPVLPGLALVCGLFWGLLRLSTGNLWASLLCHLIWDAIIMLAYPLL